MQKHVALITGGASGLGRAAAEHLHRLGARVMLADMNTEAGNALAAKLGDRAAFAEADVTCEKSIGAVLDLISSKFGEAPTAVVNTAGTLHAGKTVSRKGQAHDLPNFKRVIDVNLVGSFNVARLAAERMAQRDVAAGAERGVLINTASIAAFDGQAGQVAYSASKGAIVGMTLPMARDLSDVGVRVCTIAPGIFDTPMMAAAPPAVRESLAAQIPFPKRFGQPEEFGKMVEMIISNTYLNGEVFRLDGAVRMGA